ncbi:MAG TPA: helix-turn-helix transcriptional regulator [Thermomicrobiaceae bacterium]|nr:helix-turn-helix transcriptional regulator [Thermomicrobiaceae bacterium]
MAVELQSQSRVADGPVAAPQGQSFAELLKLYRDSSRVSQSRLAEIAGFDHSYVSRLESGNRTPTREAVIKLAAALDLEPEQRDNLLAAAGYMPQRVESLLAGEPVLSQVLQLLQRRDIPEAVRGNVRQMLELLVQQAELSAAGFPASPVSGDAVAA